MSLELDEFFLDHEEWPCTKSAFTQARYRVKSVFFEAWHRCLVKEVYEKSGRNLKTWKNLYLKGVDGSTLYLFDDEDIVKEFGGPGNQHGQIVIARSGYQVDLLNGYCSAAYIGPYRVGEPHFASQFLGLSSSRDLLIYDRNFISFELIYKHLQAGVPFLMRAPMLFNKVVEEFLQSGRKQAVRYFPITRGAIKSLEEQGFSTDANTKVKVRLVRVELESGETEILVTNLMDTKKYPRKCFKELYGKRWGCETRIEIIKNKLQAEIFTGHKPQAIYQDFFCTMIVLNLHNLLIRACDKQLEKINKHRQKPAAINKNVSIGLLKVRLVNLFETNKPSVIIHALKLLFLTHLEAIRPGRKYNREPARKRQYGKYQTHKNYRRAF
jgi:Transposase DDE domain